MRRHDSPYQNICVAIAAREVTGRITAQPNLPHRTISLHKVLRHDEGGVLLGFSSDGNFLCMYCVNLGTCYEVQWRRFRIQDFYHERDHGEAIKTVFRLRVKGDSTALGMSTPLEVWQSIDFMIVLAITIDHWTEHRERYRHCCVVVAPSPVFDEEGLAAKVISVAFEFRQHAHSQHMEKWQLLHLIPEQPNVYHLLLNTGTVVHVFVLLARKWSTRVRTKRSSPPKDKTEQSFRAKHKKMTPTGLGISHFPQLPWYYSPVFPIKFQQLTEYRQQNANKLLTTEIACICQHLFDVERFLGEFLESFTPLQHYNLMDYDIRLVRANSLEKTIFLTYVMALAPSLLSIAHPSGPNTRYLRVALFLSLELFTGTYHIIRVLKVPEEGELRQLAQVVARRFLVDLNARIVPEAAAMTWNNEAFLREEPLQELYNPVFPLAISSRNTG
ncbi:hypothetical protein CCR75_000583 [Bremia lactucae]|uniref:Uncharacterized protein n=1 Tax=Bremia lactucae TaxID=4779 RepID=A0A976IJV6_BRELC|nr:hypothetical protein CCR75_000583 [Bremia lactucae]